MFPLIANEETAEAVWDVVNTNIKLFGSKVSLSVISATNLVM